MSKIIQNFTTFSLFVYFKTVGEGIFVRIQIVFLYVKCMENNFLKLYKYAVISILYGKSMLSTGLKEG